MFFGIRDEVVCTPLSHGKSRAKSVNIGPTLYLAIEMGGMPSGAGQRNEKRLT
jgi:hypothetical protein